MYGARLTRREWLGPLAPALPARSCLPPAQAGRGTPVLAGHATDPLRSLAGEANTSRSGSLGVNVTPTRPGIARDGIEGGRAASHLACAAVTPPALTAGPDRDRTYARSAGRYLTVALAALLLEAALAVALWAPRPGGSLTGAHLVLVPALTLAGLVLLERLHQVTRRPR